VKIAKLFSEHDEKIIMRTLELLEKEQVMLQEEKSLGNIALRVAKQLKDIEAKPYWRELMLEPWKKELTIKSVIEGLAGIAAEESKILKGPLRRDLSNAAEFFDAFGTPWDVKTFVSFAPNGRCVFNAADCIKSIRRELTLGENVILNMVRLNQADTLTLVNEIQKAFSSEDIRRIITIFRHTLFN